ncbi:GntR family transcriptional regulator [Paracoccus sp. TK19116]|uniref:GntR family transcriptional regulator n=1 Tax=Paracoccus albicereus TaxID=2922394 RepID=A0ABT1MPW7_9RHOB|nr:GntR family transcriptional regulator [Paracoccus albicereus]MCQ0970347.1 GntR family transcriptional regulator [Paracoccus albicereus]
MTDTDTETSQGQGAYRRLLDEIRTGRLTPGARLRETELAARLGISRTPVREAIRQLEADGLVVHVPRQGASIRRLDYAEVMELYEMRMVLEGTAARLAARAASDAELADLRMLNEELAEAGDTAAAHGLNRQFHRTLLAAARNRFLVGASESLDRTLLILGPSTLSERTRARDAVSEHNSVMDALEARDGAAAEQAMRQHLEAAHRARLRHLRAHAPDIQEDAHG